MLPDDLTVGSSQWVNLIPRGSILPCSVFVAGQMQPCLLLYKDILKAAQSNEAFSSILNEGLWIFKGFAQWEPTDIFPFFCEFTISLQYYSDHKRPTVICICTLGQKQKQISVLESLRFLMHSWYETVNKLFMELKHLPDYWHQPQVQEKSYEECNSANSGCITQFCFPAMGKKIGVMWHHLQMLVSTLGQPYKSGIYRKGGRAVQKTLLSLFRVTAGPLGASVQIRKVPLPRTVYLPVPENCHNKYTNRQCQQWEGCP